MSCDDERGPFVGAEAVDRLYRDRGRLDRRIGALLGAKVSGCDPIHRAIDEVERLGRAPKVVVDVGCGRGGAAARLAARLRPARLVAFDRSRAMLEATRRRVPLALAIQGDFHRLPFAPGSLDLVVGAFCLYHSATPDLVCREIAARLSPAGLAALITKSRDSYAEIDELLGAAALGPARRSPGLYDTFCTENAECVARVALHVEALACEIHTFRFPRPDDLIAYVRTTPRYEAAQRLGDPELRGRLEPVWPAGGLLVTSGVAVLVGRARRPAP